MKEPSDLAKALVGLESRYSLIGRNRREKLRKRIDAAIVIASNRVRIECAEIALKLAYESNCDECSTGFIIARKIKETIEPEEKI
jgi:hypothetical protein